MKEVRLPKHVISSLVYLAEQGILFERYHNDPTEASVRRMKKAIRRARNAMEKAVINASCEKPDCSNPAPAGGLCDPCLRKALEE